MRTIPTRVHGIVDYVAAGTLLAAPRLLGLGDEAPAAARALRLAGGGALLYSALTDYELGAIRMIPMPAHLALDASSGLLLASSPWLFGFSREGTRYWLPHLLAGAFEVLAAATSRSG